MFDIIQDIINSLQDQEGKPFFFFYGTKASQNLSKKGIQFPIAYMSAFLSSNAYRAQTGFIEEKCDIEILFAYKSEIGWTDAQHGEVITKAKYAAKRFMNTLSQDKRLKSVDRDHRYDEIPRMFDLNVSGVVLSCKATPLESQKIC